MRHDEENSQNIEARLYDALQLPSQEIVEVDCERVRARLKGGTYRAGGVRADESVARRWQSLAIGSAAAAVILAEHFRFGVSETVKEIQRPAVLLRPLGPIRGDQV